MQQVSPGLFSLDGFELSGREWILDVPGSRPYFDREGNLVSVTMPRNIAALLGPAPGLLPSSPTPPQQGGSGPPLLPHQVEGIAFCRGREHSLLLHDLGLGKTFMILGAVDAPALGLIPTAAIQPWVRACGQLGASCCVLHGDTPLEVLDGGFDVYLTTYGSAEKWMPHFRRVGRGPRLRTKFADEGHILHRMGLNASQAFRSVWSPRTIIATATPVRNRLPSLWGILDASQNRAWGTRNDFLVRYAGATPSTYGGLELGELTHTEELLTRLRQVAIRRSWAEPEFANLRPDLERRIVPVNVSKSELRHIVDTSLHKVQSTARTGSSDTIKYLSAQRESASRLKLEVLSRSKYIHRQVEKHQRVIIWWWFKGPAMLHTRRLQSELDVPVDFVSGDTTPKDRARILDEWESGDHTKPRVLVATIGSLNAAVNLVTARAAIFVELDWAPISIIQAEKRHHRMNSRFERVYVDYLIAEGTLDETISRALLKKAEETELLFSGSGLDQMRTLLELEDPSDEEKSSLAVARLLEEG